MKENRFQYLMQKHLKGECTLKERKELALLIDNAKNKELESPLLDQWNKYNSTLLLSPDKTQRILHTIVDPPVMQEIIHTKPKTRIFQTRRLMYIAASVAILLSLGIFVQKANTDAYTQYNIIAKAPNIQPQKQAPFIRNITLPDGSTIVLHPGSTVDYPAKFAGKTREISLIGEAYFDIKHNSHKPFIIHTGKVKTTVLGTAFNIKAWPSQKKVIVSVTRGKVRVENEKHVLAVLTINQQISYNLQNTVAKRHQVNAERIVNDWAKQDLNFNASTLESIAQTLSKRFGKDIIITDSELAQTQIVSSFSGTASLQSILDVLCAINVNTQFIEDDHKITISYKN